jgi:hypothetical protein
MDSYAKKTIAYPSSLQHCVFDDIASFPSVTEALPQDSQIQGDNSVADAARLNREAKTNLASQSRVISNDDLAGC